LVLFYFIWGSVFSGNGRTDVHNYSWGGDRLIPKAMFLDIFAGDRRRTILFFLFLPSTFQMLGNARAPAAHKVPGFNFKEN